MQPERGENWS